MVRMWSIFLFAAMAAAASGLCLSAMAQQRAPENGDALEVERREGLGQAAASRVSGVAGTRFSTVTSASDP